MFTFNFNKLQYIYLTNKGALSSQIYKKVCIKWVDGFRLMYI